MEARTCDDTSWLTVFSAARPASHACYQKRAHNSDENLLRSVEADLPCLCWIRDPIGSDGKRGEAEQKIGIGNLACTDLTKLVAGKSDDQEKDGQKDRWRRSIVADQPDANEAPAIVPITRMIAFTVMEPTNCALINTRTVSIAQLSCGSRKS